MNTDFITSFNKTNYYISRIINKPTPNVLLTVNIHTIIQIYPLTYKAIFLKKYYKDTLPYYKYSFIKQYNNILKSALNSLK